MRIREVSGNRAVVVLSKRDRVFESQVVPNAPPSTPIMRPAVNEIVNPVVVLSQPSSSSSSLQIPTNKESTETVRAARVSHRESERKRLSSALPPKYIRSRSANSNTSAGNTKNNNSTVAFDSIQHAILKETRQTRTALGTLQEQYSQVNEDIRKMQQVNVPGKWLMQNMSPRLSPKAPKGRESPESLNIDSDSDSEEESAASADASWAASILKKRSHGIQRSRKVKTLTKPTENGFEAMLRDHQGQQKDLIIALFSKQQQRVKRYLKEQETSLTKQQMEHLQRELRQQEVQYEHQKEMMLRLMEVRGMPQNDLSHESYSPVVNRSNKQTELELKRLRQQNTSLLQENASLSSAVEDLQNNYNTADGEAKRLRDKYDITIEENKVLSRALEDAHSGASIDRRAEKRYQDEIRSLKNKCNSLTDDNISLQSDIDNITTQSSMLQRRLEKCENFHKEEVRQLSEDNNEVKKDNSVLQEVISELKNARDSSVDIASLERRHSEELKRLRERITELTDHNDNLELDIKQTRKDVTKAKAREESAAQEAVQFKGALDITKTQVVEANRMKERFEATEAELSELQDKLSMATMKLTRSEKSARHAAVQIEALTDQTEELTNSLTASNNQLEEIKKRSSDEVKHYKSKLAEFSEDRQKALNEAEEQTQKLTLQNMKAVHNQDLQNQEREGKIAMIRKEADAEVKRLKREVASSEEENRTHRMIIQDLKQQYRRLQLSTSEKEQQNQNHIDELKRARDEAFDQLRILESSQNLPTPAAVTTAVESSPSVSEPLTTIPALGRLASAKTVSEQQKLRPQQQQPQKSASATWTRTDGNVFVYTGGGESASFVSSFNDPKNARRVSSYSSRASEEQQDDMHLLSMAKKKREERRSVCVFYYF